MTDWNFQKDFCLSGKLASWLKIRGDGDISIVSHKGEVNLTEVGRVFMTCLNSVNNYKIFVVTVCLNASNGMKLWLSFIHFWYPYYG